MRRLALRFFIVSSLNAVLIGTLFVSRLNAEVVVLDNPTDFETASSLTGVGEDLEGAKVAPFGEPES